MSDIRIGSVRLSQATSELSTERLDARDRRHLERFLELPSLRQSHAPPGLAQPGLDELTSTFAEPELHNPQILRMQNFTRLLTSVDEKLSASASSDPIVKLTQLVLQQELKKYEIFREQMGALVER